MAVVSQKASDSPGLVPVGRVIITIELPARVGLTVGDLLGKFTSKHMTRAEHGSLTTVDECQMVEVEFTGEGEEES